MKRQASALIEASGPAAPGSGFVGFVSTPKNIIDLVDWSAKQGTIYWTVCEDARAGDLVVFYAIKPWYAFLAYGKVIKRLGEKWGRGKKPMAEVGMLRLLPEPVSLRRAKERLGMRWLRAAEGFANRRQEDVHLILALGGGFGGI
jgi:hypothetical protein